MKQKRILSWIMVSALIVTAAIPATKVYAGEVDESYTIDCNVERVPESVKIEGIQVVGSTLSTQFFEDTGSKIYSSIGSTYRWYRNNTLVGENETYVLSESDMNQYIKVVVINNGDIFENTIGKIGGKSLSITSGVITYGYWLNSNDGTKKYFENGEFITGWKKIDGLYYVFNSNGIMHTGWWRDNNADYYLNSNGIMVTGWANIEGKAYYFNNNGSMASNTIIDGHTLDKNGICIA